MVKMTNFDHLTTVILKFWPWSWSKIFDHLTMTPGRRPNGQKIMVILPPPPNSRCDQNEHKTNNSNFQLISSIVLWSSVLYIVSFVCYYLLFFPPTWSLRLLYATPFLVAPVFIFLINRYVNYFLEKRFVNLQEL